MLERGDHDAFVRALEPLCHKTVSKTAGNGVEYEDLMQEARFAALKVARTWTPDGGANPLTLAVLYIRNEVWKVANAQKTDKRRANYGAVRLDAPARAADPEGATRGELTAAAGPAIHEIAEQRDQVARLTRRLQLLPEPLRANLDDDKVPRDVARLRAFVAAGGEPEPLSVYVDRHPGDKATDVTARVVRAHPRSVPVRAVKRKLMNGRERAPQGRPTADGRLGTPIWRVDLLRIPDRDERQAA